MSNYFLQSILLTSIHDFSATLIFLKMWLKINIKIINLSWLTSSITPSLSPPISSKFWGSPARKSTKKWVLSSASLWHIEELNSLSKISSSKQKSSNSTSGSSQLWIKFADYLCSRNLNVKTKLP